MADLGIPIPSVSNEILQLIGWLLGVGGGLKGLQVVYMEWSARQKQKAEHDHEDAKGYTSQAWKRADELQILLREQDKEIDALNADKYNLAIKLAIAEERLVGHARGETRLSEQLATAEKRILEQEMLIADLRLQLARAIHTK
jgi:hypothetical protein